MKNITLHCYRVGLNADALASASTALVEKAKDIAVLAQAIGWDQPENRAFLEEAFSPQKNASEFPELMKKVAEQKKLKERRKQKGFPDLIAPRKGIGGWWQKRCDKKELSLPIQADLLKWLQSSKRLTLLIAMHESLLPNVMIGEPAEVPFSEISAIPRPLGDMASQLDMRQAAKLSKILQQPVHKIDASFIVGGVTGYISYQTSRGFAYFYA